MLFLFSRTGVLSVCRAAITIANPATHPVDEALEGIAIALAEEGEYASRLKVQREAIATMLDEVSWFGSAA